MLYKNEINVISFVIAAAKPCLSKQKGAINGSSWELGELEQLLGSFGQ
jgi:hypothetical protein